MSLKELSTPEFSHSESNYITTRTVASACHCLVGKSMTYIFA